MAPSAVRVVIISVSDSRTLATDEGGALVETLTAAAGFIVVGRELLPDEPETVRERVRSLACVGTSARVRPSDCVDAILLTGGTGVAPRDGTVEALAPLFQRRLDGFGELFRMLSFAEIGPAAMLSRACAGVIDGGVAVFLMPGSPAAIRLALQRLILPELGHLVSELRRSASGPEPAKVSEDHHHHHGHHDHDPRHRR